MPLVSDARVLRGDTRLQFIVAEATTNLIENPSAEYDLDGYTLHGAVMSRTLAEARFGVAGIEVTPNVAGKDRGIYYDINPATQNTIYTGSAYVKGNGSVKIVLEDLTNGVSIESDPVPVDGDYWRRVSVTGQTGDVVSGELRLYVLTSQVQDAVFYVDGMMIEEKAYATTYCDGSQPGCRWAGPKSDSQSSRDEQFRGGGRVLELNSTDLYITTTGGLGMPPITNIVEQTVLTDGAHFERQKANPRNITMLVTAVNRKAEELCENDLIELNVLRQQLVDIFSPHELRGNQAITMRYIGSEIPLSIDVRYTAGLGMEQDLRNKWKNNIFLRLFAAKPFWREDNQGTQALTVAKSIPGVQGIAGRIDGEWQALAGLVNTPYLQSRMVESPRGNIYLAAQVAAGEYAVVEWDGVQVTQVTTPTLNDEIDALAVDAQGNIYVGGEFTDYAPAGGGPTKMAVWDIVAGNFDAAGPGFGGNTIAGTGVEAFGIDENGDVWTVGDFTSTGGLPNTVDISRWDISANIFVSVSVAGNFQGPAINDILVIDSSDVYVVGSFSKGGASFADYIAHFDGTSWEEVGTGLSNAGQTLALDSRGRPVIGGGFLTAGGVTVNSIAVWTGTTYEAFDVGFNGTVFDVQVDSNGLVYAGGIFSSLFDGSLPFANGGAVWNGSTWAAFDTSFIGGSLAVHEFLVTGQGDLFFADSVAGVLDAAAINTVTNVGTAKSKPVVTILGPGNIHWLENQSSSSRIYLNLTVQEDEIVTIDFRTGQTPITSDLRGPLLESILENSDFKDFTLLPGDNKISVYATVLSGFVDLPTVAMRYEPLHLSVDGVARHMGNE